MRIVGPNCLGIMIPRLGLNATFAPNLARDGHLAFISQSGAICSSILDWSIRENVGFSGFFSVGAMIDVSWGDIIFYLADDSRTKSILIYMESIGDARSFLSAAREVALTKPIIVLKVGRTGLGAKASRLTAAPPPALMRFSTRHFGGLVFCGSAPWKSSSIWRRSWVNSHAYAARAWRSSQTGVARQP
jgi:acyl-CoA synthetase (NDP forming)